MKVAGKIGFYMYFNSLAEKCGKKHSNFHFLNRKMRPLKATKLSKISSLGYISLNIQITHFYYSNNRLLRIVSGYNKKICSVEF